MNATQKDALIVVDMQRGYVDSRLSHLYPNAYDVGAEVLDKIKTLVGLAHDNRIPVFFSAIAYSPAQTKENLWIRHLPQLASLQIDSPLVEIDSRVGFRPETDTVILKQYPSIFTSPVLVPSLRTSGISRCVFCGITLSGCVFSSVVDALSNGFTSMVVSDAVADRSVMLRDTALNKVKATYGKLVTVQEVTDGWTSNATELSSARQLR
jgi:maleamate amidohydrolase